MTSPVLNKDNLLKINRQNSIYKLDSSVKIVKILKKINLSICRDVFLCFFMLKRHEKFNKILNASLNKRLKEILVVFSKVQQIFFTISTESLSIKPRSDKIIKDFSVKKETSITLLPLRSIFSPCSINYRYSSDDISNSQIVNFDMPSRDAFLLSNAPTWKAVENTSIISLDNSEKNILLDYSIQGSCDEDLQSNNSDKDSIIRFDIHKDITIDSEESPIFSTLESKNFENYKRFGEKIFKSTLTVSESKGKNTKNQSNKALKEYSFN